MGQRLFFLLFIISQMSNAQNCFDIGSSKATVRKVQGTPTSVMNLTISETWYYELSSITFKNGVVDGYRNDSYFGDKLRICASTSSHSNQPSLEGDNIRYHNTRESYISGSGLNKNVSSGYLINTDVGFNPFIGKTSNNVNMRFGPSTSYGSMGTVAYNSLLYIISTESIGGFYKVIDISSGEIGWLHKKYVNFHEDIEIKSGGGFRSTGYISGYSPQISVKNSSSYTIKLILGNVIHELRPYASKTITTSVGKISYIATAPGVKPASGVHSFESSNGYEWEFWVSTSRY